MNNEINNANTNLFVSRLVNALARVASNESQPCALSVAQNWKAAFAQLDAGFSHATR
jgi:hypothetical protein